MGAICQDISIDYDAYKRNAPKMIKSILGVVRPYLLEVHNKTICNLETIEDHKNKKILLKIYAIDNE